MALGVVVPQQAVAETPGVEADEATASRYAQARGESVVVESATTETDELRANPDGSFTFTQHLQPVRVRRDGGWVPVDLALERRADGMFGPKAAPVDVVFSPGGVGSADDAVARVARDGHAVGLGWGEDLPPAVVDGASLTYPEVLPGVDLKVEATLGGFSEVLVVKTPQAGQSEELERIAFRTHAEGVRVEERSDESGALVVKDAAGTPVLSGDASSMWDSSGGSPDNHTEGPAEGDRRAEMDVEVGADTVAVLPDREFLAARDTTYPVLIDPGYYCPNCGKVHHVVVQEPWPDARNFDRTDGALGDLKAGFLNAASLNAGRNGRSRTYLQMHTAPIVGKYIDQATLRTTVVGTYSCSPSATQLYLSPNIDGNTTWANQPGWYYLLSESNVANNPTYCPGPSGADFDATRAVRQASNEGWNWTTFLLQAKNEGELDTSWRRFDLNPYLEVVYNSWPFMPTALGMEGWGPGGSDAIPCVTGVGRSAVFTRTPRLRARMNDPDGGIMDAMFRVFDGVAPNLSAGYTDHYTNGIPAGSFAEVTVPSGRITHDGLFTWRVWGSDHGLFTGTVDCEFEVDSVAPSAPVVSSSDYLAVDGPHGSVGRTGTFTFNPGVLTGLGGTMDVRRYGWSLNDDTAITHSAAVQSADGTVTVPITPTKVGTNVLYVTAFDRAGNRPAANAVYVFDVAGPADVKAGWTFDETGGSVAQDSAGNKPLTVTGGSFAAGYSGNGLSFSSGAAVSSGPVVDTSRAFSVSTWVKLDRVDGYFTAVSQDGGSASSFFLGYSQDVNRWTMAAPGADSNTAGTARASSTSVPQTGVWTNLVGTYDPDSDSLKLYVDGRYQGAATVATWNATGAFVVGAAKWGGARVNRFPGSVDHTLVWDRVLAAEEVATQANLAVLRARYTLDERTGTTTVDRVSGQNASLTGELLWGGYPSAAAPTEEKWLNFGSAGTGEVAAPQPVLFSSARSYTVSAWVQLSGDTGVRRVAVSGQDGAYSPFTLGYNGTRWEFSVSQSASGPVAAVALSDFEAMPGQWVHLVATFDATTGRIALFANGFRQSTFSGTTADGSGVTSRSTTGGLRFGRATVAGAATDRWTGDLDDVHVYSGLLADDDILDLCNTTFHF
ncbi:LamG-like jellyroll fold domain-containing protein [Saccharothrix syringae]|uniref:LamG domain-containing protein n=1 Tax=Saccharothrix syringae TaxID=103733 RepID=A0A5Q0GWW0_SACSY|nr:LamG-like jellyroll fold domain-containing protein [Saccharothrix syringae]QFZ18537.1 LamG domain-containing protein [Saccharothrix syringae]